MESPLPRLRPMPPTPAIVHEIVIRALIEDLSSGDLTTEATVPSELTALGVAISKSPLLACGSTVAQAVFAAVDPKIEFESLVADGTWVPTERVLWEVRGSARGILMAERTALNFVQHLSGIATLRIVSCARYRWAPARASRTRARRRRACARSSATPVRAAARTTTATTSARRS
jgi:nicotinate-nucleotide pyrophosphorylase (carboxylating)